MPIMSFARCRAGTCDFPLVRSLFLRRVVSVPTPNRAIIDAGSRSAERSRFAGCLRVWSMILAMAMWSSTTEPKSMAALSAWHRLTLRLVNR